MRLPKLDADALVRGGIDLAALYAVLAAWLAAFRMPHVETPTRVLACLSVVALLERARVHPALRETGVMLLRGGVVTALFMASTDFGPAPAQIRRAGQEIVVAALLRILVLIAQARRAAEIKQEREAGDRILRQVASDVQALTRRPSVGSPVEHTSPPTTGGAGTLLVAEALVGVIAAQTVVRFRRQPRRTRDL